MHKIRSHTTVLAKSLGTVSIFAVGRNSHKGMFSIIIKESCWQVYMALGKVVVVVVGGGGGGGEDESTPNSNMHDSY